MCSFERTAGDPPAAEKMFLPLAGSLRCSDVEREQTSVALYRAAGDGRLTMDETEERLGMVYTARFRHELDALTIDLPTPQVRSGWGLVIDMARRQLSDDVVALTGRAPDGDSNRVRRKVLTVVVLAVVLLVSTMMVLVMHYVLADASDFFEYP
jgi:Domain of unknown function (DUF1707)